MTTESIYITIAVDNTARADVLLTSSRAYYRFATTDTCEEGEMPYCNSAEIFDSINQTLSTNEQEPMPHDVKCIVTITSNGNNKTKYDNENISLTAYNLLINTLSRISDEFMFVRGFK